MEKVTYEEMCKTLKFDHKNEWCLHSPESVLENETHKILWDFKNRTDYLISARRPDLVIVNNKRKKRTYRIVDFAVLTNLRLKLKESEKKDIT